MHFRHHSHSTTENQEVNDQDQAENSPVPTNASQVSLVSQGSGHLHRKLSEKIHSSLKAHAESFLVLNPEWNEECAELAKRHKDRRHHNPHSETTMIDMMARSSAAAGYGAVHASTFPVVQDEQHAFNAPDYDAPSNSRGPQQDAYPLQPPVARSDQPTARVGPQENGIALAYNNQHARKPPARRTRAPEISDESPALISGPAQQYENTGSSSPHLNPNANPIPAQLQIRPKPTTPPYPSPLANASATPCTAKVTIKSTAPIIDIIRQVQVEGFFKPENVTFLPAHLEMRLRRLGVGGVQSGGVKAVEAPGCMPDARSFGGVVERGGDEDIDRGEGDHELGSNAEGGGEVGEGNGEEHGGGQDNEDHSEGEGGDDGYEDDSHHEAGDYEHREGSEAGEYDHDEGSDAEGHAESDQAGDDEHGDAADDEGDHEADETGGPGEYEHGEGSEDEGHEAEVDGETAEPEHGDESEGEDHGEAGEDEHGEVSEDEGHGEGEEIGEDEHSEAGDEHENHGEESEGEVGGEDEHSEGEYEHESHGEESEGEQGEHQHGNEDSEEHEDEGYGAGEEEEDEAEKSEGEDGEGEGESEDEDEGYGEGDEEDKD